MKKLSHLEDHIGYWMRFVSNHVSQSFRKKLEEYDVGVEEWVVMRKLALKNTLSPGILAEMTGMTRGAMSKLLDRLFQKMLIERVVSSKDRRFQEIQLSDKGEKLLPRLSKLADENDGQFFDHLSKEQKQQMLTLLKEIVRKNQWSQIPIS